MSFNFFSFNNIGDCLGVTYSVVFFLTMIVISTRDYCVTIVRVDTDFKMLITIVHWSFVVACSTQPGGTMRHHLRIYFFGCLFTNSLISYNLIHNIGPLATGPI